MPKVRQQRATGKARRTCGRAGCGKDIQKGEQYFTWSFRSVGRQVRCLDHPPLRSELTSGRMSEVYAAIETAEQELTGNTETVEDVKNAVLAVAEPAREVIDAWREAAENFGGGGPNAERADELEGWVDELENFEPDEPEVEELEEEDQREQALARIEEDADLSLNDAMQQIQDEWDEEHDGDEETREEALSNARNEAQELLGQCPL
jgi:hypothetical protein